MTETEKDVALTKYKTTCCKASWVRKGRANYRCVKCDKDITLDLVFLREVL